MTLKLKILGCGGNLGAGRETTSFLCYNGELTETTDLTLIDGGTGVSKIGLNRMSQLKDVFITHSHLDHVAGIALLAEAFFNEDIEIICKPTFHCGKITYETINESILQKHIWMRLEEMGLISYKQIEDGETHFLKNGLSVTAVKSFHCNLTLGYVVSNGSSAFAFAGDTGYCESFWKTVSSVENLKGVICEVSLENKLKERAELTNHMTPEFLQKGISFLKKDVKIYASHIKSYCYRKVCEELKQLDREIIVLEDDMILEF